MLVQYSKHCSKNIRDRSKIEIMRTGRYNYIDKNVRARESPETSTCEVLHILHDVSRKLYGVPFVSKLATNLGAKLALKMLHYW